MNIGSDITCTLCQIGDCKNVALYWYRETQTPMFNVCEECMRKFTQATPGSEVGPIHNQLEMRKTCCTMCGKPHIHMCFCEFPPIKLCDEHRETHDGGVHCWFPSERTPMVASVEERDRLVSRKNNIEKTFILLNDQLAKAVGFRETFSCEMNSLITVLDSKKSYLLAQIDQEIVRFTKIKEEIEGKLQQLLLDLSIEPQSNIEIIAVSPISTQFRDDLQFFICYQRVESVVLDAIDANFVFKFDDYWLKDTKSIENPSELVPIGELGYFLPIFLENVVEKRYISPQTTLFPLKSLETITDDSRFSLISPSDLLITGGKCSRKQAFRLNVNTMVIRPLPDMNSKRGNHGMIHVNGIIYVFGGFDGNDEIAQSEKWPIDDTKWTNIGRMTAARCGFTPCAKDGKIYIIGGVYHTNCEVFLTNSEKFKSLSWKLPTNQPAIAIPMCDSLLIFQGNKHFTVKFCDRGISAVGIAVELTYRSRIAPVKFRNQWMFLAWKDEKEVIVQFDCDSEAIIVT